MHCIMLIVWTFCLNIHSIFVCRHLTRHVHILLRFFFQEAPYDTQWSIQIICENNGNFVFTKKKREQKLVEPNRVESVEFQIFWFIKPNSLTPSNQHFWITFDSMLTMTMGCKHSVPNFTFFYPFRHSLVNMKCTKQTYFTRVPYFEWQKVSDKKWFALISNLEFFFTMGSSSSLALISVNWNTTETFTRTKIDFVRYTTYTFCH